MIPLMRDAGTRIVGGVAPGHGGGTAHGMDLFDTVAEARAATGADTSVIYSPPFAVADAIVEAAEAGLSLAVAAVEFAPVHYVAAALARARDAGLRVVGAELFGATGEDRAIGLLGFLAAALQRAEPGDVRANQQRAIVFIAEDAACVGLGLQQQWFRSVVQAE